MSTSHLRPPSDIAISGPTDITVPKCNLGPPILTKRFGYKKNHSSKHPLFVSTPPLPLRSFADDMLRSGNVSLPPVTHPSEIRRTISFADELQICFDIYQRHRVPPQRRSTREQILKNDNNNYCRDNIPLCQD
ncbi:uncharacterized protein LOC111266055 isoform X2 [Varroa jacobsoni]|uniref:uncharacterized protein LOC111266055 isoform X2 n=1 Tax=Varroa jacobsoni TaxID=62625 RepID=UPI000BF2C274|nr:uncharacterized protein LOC111266055 isoform X2 [Varroa jacobsoni]